MTISLITATYNSINFLPKAIDSIQMQSYSNIELIIIDGGSTDGTLEFIESIEMNKKFISEPDSGIYDALNKGIRLASGEIIGFLHSDDMLAYADTLQKIHNVFDTELVDGVYGDLLMISPKRNNKNIRIWASQDFSPRLLNYGWMPPHPTLFLRRSVYEKHGHFDQGYKISADYDFILRIFKDKSLKFKYLPVVITKMRLGGISNGSINKLIKKSIEDYQILRKNKVPRPLLILLLKKIRKVQQFISI